MKFRSRQNGTMKPKPKLGSWLPLVGRRRSFSSEEKEAKALSGVMEQTISGGLLFVSAHAIHQTIKLHPFHT